MVENYTKKKWYKLFILSKKIEDKRKDLARKQKNPYQKNSVLILFVYYL